MAQEMGVPTKKRSLAPIQAVQDCPENLYMTKSDFIKKRKAITSARLKAEEAYRKALEEENVVENTELIEADNEVRKQRQLLKSVSDKLAEQEAELMDAEGNEKANLKRQIGKTKKKIEDTEIALADSEEKYMQIKSQA